MQKSSLIGHTIELFHAIVSTTQPADGVVKEFFRARHYLGSKDRRFVTEAIYGMLRHFRLIEIVGSEGLRQYAHVLPPRRPAIVDYAVYAIKILREDPGSIQDGISGLWRVYMPNINCMDALTAMATVVEAPPMSVNSVARLGIIHSFPERIVNEWVDRFGASEAEELCKALNSPAPTTIRVNTLKTTVDECQKRLASEGVTTTRTLLSPFGLKLEKRINVNALASYKEGFFEMQDEGSQLLSMLLNVRPGQTVMDACAGGGGKTVHLAALMNNTGVLIATDTDEKRLSNIRPRLQRAGATCARLHRSGYEEDEIRSLTAQVDALLIDAPCSGVGVFRRNPGAKRTFTSGFVERVAKTQRCVLESYCTLVRPGGVLVYCTCTLLRQENEDQVELFLNDHPEFRLASAPEILVNQGVQVETGSPYLTLLPHTTTTDGFFAAVLARAI